MMINQISPKFNNSVQVYSAQTQKTNFTSAATNTIKANKSNFFAPVKKFFKPFNRFTNKLKTKIAFGLAKFLGNKNVASTLKKLKSIKFIDKNLVAHCSALTGLVLSGFYVKKTLENDKLDPNKRRTLAINQALVCGFSTVSAYTINGFTDKSVNKFTDRYLAVHGKESFKTLEMYKNGINAAKSIMIFGLIYRFIAPVFVTPIANHIGNKMQKNNEAESKVNQSIEKK